MDEQRAAAYHEAGHAVCAYALGLVVGRASIEPDEDSLGRVHVPFRDDIAFVWESSNDPADDEYLEKHLVCYMAGAKAEEILAGEETDLEGTDMERAADFVLHLAGTEQERQMELSSRAFDRAESLLRANWHIVDELAGALVRHGVLSREQVMEIMNGVLDA